MNYTPRDLWINVRGRGLWGGGGEKAGEMGDKMGGLPVDTDLIR